MERIFISYKRVDKDKVFKIKDQIESALGEKCWIDLDGIESDAQFKNVIIRAINDCEVFLFMYSKSHLGITDWGKDWTIRELSFAESKNKRIVFINLDGSLLSDEFVFDFGTKQHVDGLSIDAMNKLIRDMKKWLSLPLVHAHKKSDTQTKGIHIEDGTDSKKEKKKLSITANAALKNKGCTIAISAAFMLLLIILPINHMLFNNGGNISNVEDTDIHLNIQVLFDSVNLGLPSGTIWADRNLGCESPKDCGYITEDLDFCIVYPELCEEWQLPTKEQFDELINYCTWEWLDDCHGYEMVYKDEKSIKETHHGQHMVMSKSGDWLYDFHGYKITSKNGNVIYLPASGSYTDDHQLIDLGIRGRYWIEGHSSNEGRSDFLQINRNNVFYDESPNNCACSIRLVKKNKNSLVSR